MSAAARLRAMVEAATPGPWKWQPKLPPNTRVTALRSATATYEDYRGVPVGVLKALDYLNEHNAALIALAPKLAAWAADAADELEGLAGDLEWVITEANPEHDGGYARLRIDNARALLARLAGIVGEPE